MDIVGPTMGTKKRFWPDDEKRSICLQTKAPGVSVAQVARRYSMNANLIHNRLRDHRFAPEAEDEMPEGVTFLPIEIEGVRAVPGSQMAPLSPAGSLSTQRVDITLSDGRQILLEGSTALSAVLALVEGLIP